MAQPMIDFHNFSLLQSQSELEQEQKDMGTLLSTFTEEIGNQQDQRYKKKKLKN